MKKLSLILAPAMLAAMMIYAQAQQAPQQVATLGTVTLTVTVQELQVISNALAERPFKEVQGLWNKLSEQLAAQQNPKPDPKPE